MPKFNLLDLAFLIQYKKPILIALLAIVIVTWWNWGDSSTSTDKEDTKQSSTDTIPETYGDTGKRLTPTKKKRKKRRGGFATDVTYPAFVKKASEYSLEAYKDANKGKMPASLLEQLDYNDYPVLHYAFDEYAKRFVLSLSVAKINWQIVDSLQDARARRSDVEDHYFKILNISH